MTGVFPSNFVVEVNSESPRINKKDLNEKSDSDSLDGNKSSLQRDDSLEKKPKPIAKIGFGDIFAGGKVPKLSPIGDNNKSVPKKPPPPTPAFEAEAAPKLPPKPVREQAKVLFAYEAQNDDELTIKEGDIITIVSKEIEDVGWWKGELNGRIALFPDNFVELIKTEEPNSTKANKKPERPTEKPPPIAIASNHSKASNLLKSDSIKSSNKTFEELPKTSVVSNSSSGVTSAPVIPGKPVLNSSLFKSKPKPEPQPPTVPSSVKPDVVPQENGSKHDNDVETNGKPNNVINNGSENHFTSIDANSNKLTHLTQSRPKGPSSRRPPSALFLSKEAENESKENGDISAVQNRIETNSSHSSTEPKPTTAEKSPPEKLPPWMVELRKAQEKRKAEDAPKSSNSSPTKSSPNRFSGDFSNKSLQSSTTEESDSNSIHSFKPPLKSTKPVITATPVVNTTPVITESVSTVSNVTTTANTTSKIVISSATTTASVSKPTPKVEDSTGSPSADKKSDVLELEKEIRALKESTVSRKDFDSLVKQVFNQFSCYHLFAINMFFKP